MKYGLMVIRLRLAQWTQNADPRAQWPQNTGSRAQWPQNAGSPPPYSDEARRGQRPANEPAEITYSESQILETGLRSCFSSDFEYLAVLWLSAGSIC